MSVEKSVLVALRALGCTASLRGAEPTNADEYLERVEVHTGQRPSWETVNALASGAPIIISDRQFFQQLANTGNITQDEALAAVGPGTMPAPLGVLLSQLPVEQQFSAKMLLVGATQFDRTHPLVQVLATAFGWGAGDILTFWATASTL